MARIDCISTIDRNGEQYYIVVAEEPSVNRFDLWDGGKCYSFNLNHRKQVTDVYFFGWRNGVASNFKKIKTFDDEILGEKEMIKFVESCTVNPGH